MKYTLIILFIAIIIVGGFLLYTSSEKEQEITKEMIIGFLEKNETGSEFMREYGDFDIETANILTKEEIAERKVEGDYRDIFYPLTEEDNKYAEIKLNSKQGKRGVVATLNLENEEVVEIFYVFMINITQ